jgi:CRISPR-associated endonuclease Cas3-HD
MLEVGFVAQALLDEDASPRWRNVLGKVFGTEASTLVDWLPWVVALHDIGKISAAFQEQKDTQRERLIAEGFPLGARRWQHEPFHSLISQVFLGWELGYRDIPKRFLRMWRKLCKQETEATEKVITRLLPEPEAEDSFCGPASHLNFEESETSAGWVIAQTRLGEESINIIPLETDGVSVQFSSKGQEYRTTIDGSSSREMQLRLLRRSLRVKQA